MIESFEKIIDPNFLNAELIGEPGAFRVVTIKDIDYLEAYNQKTNAKEKKQSLILEECKPLILNKTNAKTLKKLFSPNEDDPSLCVGHKIELYVISTRVGGKPTTGIRIREHSVEKCDQCGKEIQPLPNMNVEQTVAYSKKYTGKKLCIDCMRKWKEEQK